MTLYQNTAYQQYNPTWHIEDSPWKARQILKMLQRAHQEPQTICEVGCGAGGILVELSRQLPEEISFSGYEISQAAYQLCLANQKDNIRFYLADLLVTDSPSYDLLLMIDVIEHVEDIFGFLRGLKSKAAYKLLHIPLDFNLINLLRPQILTNMRREIGHIHSFTRETALALLSETGYEVLDWFYTPGAIELSSTTRKMARLNPLRKLGFRINPELTVRLLGGYSLMVLTQ